jgi:hypothetical protein
MGLFDDLLKTTVPGIAGGGQQEGRGLAAGLLEMLAGQQTGGLQGLVQSFTQKGIKIGCTKRTIQTEVGDAYAYRFVIRLPGAFSTGMRLRTGEAARRKRP